VHGETIKSSGFLVETFKHSDNLRVNGAQRMHNKSTVKNKQEGKQD
jgi:hypothetical protein